jgi:aminomuconate-semialdehyde/2-hydroxymuconate-6-semialdehyde dehydrogenase
LAGSRLLVEEKIASEVIERMLSEIKNIVIGDPLDEKTTMGSLISVEQRDRVANYVEVARGTDGAEILCGGKIPDRYQNRGAYYEPTLITGLRQDSRLIQEEIFGPVVTVQTFKTADEALALLNGTKYGLSCSIWSKNDKTRDYMAAKARFGMVWLNTWFNRNLNTPFGGMKASGVGREGGQYSLDFFSDWKTVTYA